MNDVTISIGANRKAKTWRQHTMSWADFVRRATTFKEGRETMDEYLALPKDRQAQLKDVGGFVGGTLAGGVRRKGCCTERSLITLDLDNLAPGSTDSWIAAAREIGVAFVCYSTRKHRPEAPRLRFIFPVSRPMTPDEYQPVARMVASLLDPTMRAFDRTTFEVERLMYWPSACRNAERIAVQSAGNANAVDVDGFLLCSYNDWHDFGEWPLCPGEDAPAPRELQQADPLTKDGVIGLFCTKYSIQAAIAEFDLPYTPAGENRYTYTHGTTVGGAIVYDDKFLYSHHSTDPACGQLCNAFDLVRIHKYGADDREAAAGTPTEKLPSYKSMLACARERTRQEFDSQALDGFDAVADSAPAPAASAVPEGAESAAQLEDGNWRKTLLRTNKGAIANVADNICKILEHDPQLKGRIWNDQFIDQMRCKGPLPWPGAAGERNWQDADDAGIRWYFESVYGITGAQKVYDAVAIVATEHAKDPVVEYLQGLTWDGLPRLDTLFIDFLGAPDTPYTRAVTRKMWVAAVKRALVPGAKFDQMLVLSGGQGVGKSLLLQRMGKDWFNDSIQTFQGREAQEGVRGTWICEIAELTAMNKSELEATKQFISSTEDKYRPAYGRRVGVFKRRCVFFGSTNDQDYLRDSTGNRRFWPVEVDETRAKASVFEDLSGDYVDQVWAEARVRYFAGESLVLEGETAAQAAAVQESHMERDPWAGRIEDFVERPIPADWQQWPLDKRRDWWGGGFVNPDEVQTQPRDRICIAEIWCELLGQEEGRIDVKTQRRIGAILSKIPGWTNRSSVQRCGAPYGRQKAWTRQIPRVLPGESGGAGNLG